jgi:hypothetical protein
MRRLGIVLLALGYGMSFIAACLSACLVAPVAEGHACCASDESIRAADRSCCSTTPAVTHAQVQAATAHPLGGGAMSSPVTVTPPLVAAPAVVPFPAASPPIVLRV